MNYLKVLRTNSGLSQRDVSEKMGYTTPQFVSNWERGVSLPPILSVRKLAKLYRANPNEIYNILEDHEILQVKKKFNKVRVRYTVSKADAL